MKWPVQSIHISYDNESFRWCNVDCFLFLLSWICLLLELTAWVTHRVSNAKQEQLTFRDLLVSSTVFLLLFFFLVRSVMLMFLVFYDVFCFFIRLSSSLCAQCCLCLCIVYSWLLFYFLYRLIIIIIKRIKRILGWSDDRHLYISSFYIPL